jgi:hypothetical protein
MGADGWEARWSEPALFFISSPAFTLTLAPKNDAATNALVYSNSKSRAIQPTG